MYQLLYVSFIDQWFNRLTSNGFLNYFLETEICFVLTPGKDTSEFNLIKRTIKYIVGEYGCHSAKYCVVLRGDHKEGWSTEAALRTWLTSYSGQTLPVHSIKILKPPKVHSQTKHIGKKPKR